MDESNVGERSIASLLHKEPITDGVCIYTFINTIIGYFDEKTNIFIDDQGREYDNVESDLAIFGTLMNLPESTLATASAQLYQPNDGQPYLGIVKINKNIDYSKPNSQIYFESILVHEFTHILGFSHHFFSNYLKQIEYKVDEDGINRIYLTSPKLLEVAKKYYACDTLEGVELENQGGNGTAGFSCCKGRSFS